MKKIICIILIVTTCAHYGKTQTTNDILELLILNKTITQAQSDSVRAEAAIKQQAAEEKKKSFSITAGQALQLTGYTQLRYQLLEEKGQNDGFDIRRAYLGLKGNLSPYWGYRFQVDFAGTPKIIDAYVDLNLKDYFNIAVGQQLVPFSLNNLTSNAKLILADRAQVVEALVGRGKDVIGNNNGRDIGLAISGSFLKINNNNLIEYRLGVFNGSGIIPDKNEAKDFIGRLLIHPVKGLDVGASYINGWTAITDSTDAVIRERMGVELNYTWKILTLSGEYIQGKDGSKERAGYYAEAAVFVIPKILQLAARYDTYDKDTDASKKDDITTKYILGANYFINPYMLLQAAYTIREEEGTNIDNNITSLQLQISF